MQFYRGAVTVGGIGLARFANDCIKLAHKGVVGLFQNRRWHFREQAAIPSHRGFIEDLAQGINIRGNRARPFRRNVTLGAEPRHFAAVRPDVSDQTNIGELRRTVYVNDVGRFDIPVNELLVVQVIQRQAQVDTQAKTFLRWKLCAPAKFRRQCFGRIMFGIDALTGGGVVADLHDVKEKSLSIVAADVKDMDEARM